MRVEQAVFTSASTRRHRGYHLVGRSAGINDRVAQDLIRWCPTHASLADTRVNAQSINCFPVSDGRISISRTVYGGPEYSARGALQVVTLMLVVRGEQLCDYDYNPLHVYRTASVLGWLRLVSHIPADPAAADLPDRRLSACDVPQPDTQKNKDIVARSIQLLRDGHRVGYVNVLDPTIVLDALLRNVTPAERLNLSFATGLKPSHHRPFCLQFFDAATADLKATWTEQGIRCIDPTS
jgi:hypothetical protein